MAEPLLKVEELHVHHRRRGAPRRNAEPFRALDGVSLELFRGEVLGIVGESGAGKSTLARCVVGVQRPTSGELRFAGQPLDPGSDREQRRAIQMVFQDPYASLNPAMTIGTALGELLRVNGLAADRKAAKARAGELLELVGLPTAALERRPRAFSGGQRQRIGIARALALEPRLLVADEPVSALDVSVQASILKLLKRLQKELALTVLLISHDLAVVHQLCDRVIVLRDGKVVERGAVRDLFASPKEPYTRELLAAAPDLPPLAVPPLQRGVTAPM
jgi:ABC-type glutathione transport system ATPase component